MGFMENKNKYQDTYYKSLDMMNNDLDLKQAIKDSKHIYYDTIKLDNLKMNYKTDVIVLDDEVTNVILKYHDEKTCVLGLSSGLLSNQNNIGCHNSYEDTLFRSTTLSKCIDNSYCISNFYLNNRNCHSHLLTNRILTITNVILFRNELLDKYLVKKDWVNIDVVMACSPDLTKSDFKKELIIDTFKKRIFNIFCAMAKMGAKTIVLGAYGCGKAENSPSIVSAIFKEVINMFDGVFNKIVFAIKGTNIENTNYDIFKKNLIS